ncbi:Rz family phage outer membrane lytic protein [Buttiauxella gaviniae ATCC 51604]|uniref:Rz family phage outer membrane lytic protein n=1 Tax=Buttiauxella gaviniae ATCC 51604 TaxID=1354253 RepID=A0A1B7I525_9ENTR|nr:Rz family phage outer membrane lytic protein [Buttiauxella gaviniae ATCC 51604]
MSANYYHTKYQDEKRRADKSEKSLGLAKQTISDMQTRQRDVAALDAKYTGELANAKATIEQLQRDVAAGTKRLRLAATCSGVSSITSTTSVDDVAGPRLTDAAQRDYFTLRERIETSRKMIAGMQAYIIQQCLK